MHVEYDYALVLRLDHSYGSLRCVVGRNRPLDVHGALGIRNRDILSLLPRGYFRFFSGLVERCHAPAAKDDSLWTATQNLTLWRLGEQHRKKTKKHAGRGDPDRDSACYFTYHQGINYMLDRCGEAKTASQENTSHAVCGKSRARATKAAFKHFQGRRAFFLGVDRLMGGAGGVSKITGDVYDPASCGCDVSLARPHWGPPSLETLLSGIDAPLHTMRNAGRWHNRAR